MSKPAEAEYTLEQVKDIIKGQVERLHLRCQDKELDEADARKLETLTKTLLQIIEKQPKKRKYTVSGKKHSNDDLLKYAKNN